ncbi:MAG: sigma 54-dependent Fis family transcriptional regulator, partial [Polyangiaceae bacterium]|nr:sigma 54-dependent Fis family transcriptional regulator [Polyangiaceae bacterium]
MADSKVDQTKPQKRPPGSLLASSVGVRAVVLSGAHRGQARLVGRTLAIGKSDEADLVLTDASVSRTHCELRRTREGILVRDLDSTNGTYVDGVRIHEVALRPGAIFRVGDVDIHLQPSTPRIDVMPSESSRFGLAVGGSLAMRTVFGVLEHIAPTDATVLLLGETGTGKEVLARSILAESRRAAKPFVTVDLGGISRALLESELFGHERGAFTGAENTRVGAFERAHGGTIFLDELGELPLDLQPKLLRVLEARTIQRVGGSRVQDIDVRIIAATCRDLEQEVSQGRFREDLFFRVAVVPVRIPPLRERSEDIPLLADTILQALPGGRPLDDEVYSVLMAQAWRGNVREMRNVLERASHLARGARITLQDLALSHERELVAAVSPQAFELSLAEARLRFDRHYARTLLERFAG